MLMTTPQAGEVVQGGAGAGVPPATQPETQTMHPIPPAEGAVPAAPAPAPEISAPTSASPPAPVSAPTPAGQDVIIVSGQKAPPPNDPAQAINAISYEAVQAVDKAIIGPVAHGYKAGVPKLARKGIRNAINNLDEPIVFVNFLLQLKPGKALETLGRFTLNSTVGLAGLIDVAKVKPFNLPRRSNGLADTLGYYGVGPGPYLFLPIIGSTTVRDMFGRMLDLSLVPTVAGNPFNKPVYGLAKGGLSALDERSNLDEELEKIRDAGNPYAAHRTYYLKRRKAEILALHSQEYRDRKAAEEAAAEAAEKERARSTSTPLQTPALPQPAPPTAEPGPRNP